MSRTTPIAVMIDRSRDGVGYCHLTNLHRDPAFFVTENERRLTAQRLGRCDVLVIRSAAARAYTPDELGAIDGFVGNGGGLLLAASASAFELEAGKPVAASAAHQVAELFGAGFVGPSDARGPVAWTPKLERGYPRADLALHARTGPLKGLEIEELPVRAALPVVPPKGATRLLRHRKTGEPVAATFRHGNGRALIAGVPKFGMPWQTIGRRAVRWLAERRRGRTDREPLPERVAGTWHAVRRGKIRVRYRNVRRTQLDPVLDLIEAELRRVTRQIRRLRSRQWKFVVVPGTGWDWWRDWRTGRGLTWIGADACRPSLIDGLVHSIYDWALQTDGLGSLMGRTVGPETLAAHMARKAMTRHGHGEEAERRRAVLASWPEGEGDPERVDLGWWRAEAGPSPAAWLWPGLEADFGDDLLEKLLRDEPETFPWKKFPHRDVSTELDILVYYLSLAAGEDLFPWFAARGHTVHPLPILPAADRRFLPRCLRNVRRQFRDTDQPTSERYDAARVLMRNRNEKRVSLHAEANRLGDADEADELVSAMRLARARDARGREALLRLSADADDEDHAAIAAVALTQTGDDRAADRLAELAEERDARFKLDARAALRRVGRDLEVPLRIVVQRQLSGEHWATLRYLAEIDGRVGANVFSGRYSETWPGGVQVPHYYVQWVHTAPKWRRKGLSRELLARTVADPWFASAPTAALDTGTRNVAHVVYRGAGFVDGPVSHEWTKELDAGRRCGARKGVEVRAATARDVRRMADLFNEVYADHVRVDRQRPRELTEGSIAMMAKAGGRLGGYIRGRVPPPDRKGRVEARVAEIAVRPGDHVEKVARALIAGFCGAAAREKATRVKTGAVPEGEAIERAFEAEGFARKKTGGVDMWRLNDLPALLGRLRPLLERRLREKKRHDWHGVVGIRGETHAAGLRVERGRVHVLQPVPDDPELRLAMDDATLSRVLLGRETVFEAMLQDRLSLAPRANKDVTTLLDALFPRMLQYPH